MSSKRQEAPEDFEQDLETLERKLDRLRVLFEQYFLGIEKLPPLPLQRDIVRILHDFSNYHIRKTTHKFRYQALVQRFNVHRAYWQRTMRAIEEGHHKRDQSRVKRRSMARSGEAIDNAELAKRALLSAEKGEEAVDQRRLRQQDGDSTPAFMRGVERRRAKRTQRRNAQETPEIRGVSSEELRRRAESLSQDSDEFELQWSQITSTNANGDWKPASPPDSDDQPFTPPKLFTDKQPPAQRSMLDFARSQPQAPPPPPLPHSGSAGPVSHSSSRSATLPPPPPLPVVTPTNEPARPASNGHPPVRPKLGVPAPARPAQSSAQNTLRAVGISDSRARRIYEDFIAARRQQGQSVDNISYEKLAASMAKQAEKARQTLGSSLVDFDVVTRQNQIFLKPKPK